MMRVPLCCAALFLAWLSPVHAASNGGDVSNKVLSEDEVELRYITRRRERAANFVLEHAEIYPSLPPEYHAAAQAELERAQRALEMGRYREARKIAERAHAEFEHSDAAAELLHLQFRSYAATGQLRLAKLLMVDIWERHPGYPGATVMLEEALLVADLVQKTGPLFNLSAITPEEVINRDNRGDLLSSNRVYRFLAVHGDRATIAPRAALGLARASLLRGISTREDLLLARLKYEDFFEDYPDSPLIFDALCEQAVSYLVSYRGDQFDMGVLTTAEGLINQAEVYVQGDTERQRIVREFRALIRRWKQDHDLQVARWYADKGYIDAARRYYDETIKRDSTSAPAIAAKREQAELPSPEPTGLGTAAPADATP